MKRLLQCISIITCLIFLLVLSRQYEAAEPFIFPEEESTPKSIQTIGAKVRNSLVWLELTESDTGVNIMGSGSILGISKTSVLVVTAAHVAEKEGNKCHVLFYEGTQIEGETILVNNEKEIGVVRIAVSDLPDHLKNTLTSIEVHEDSVKKLQINDRFFMPGVMGTEGDADIFYGSIVEPAKYLEEFQAEMIYGNGYAMEGMSGCGLFDESGCFLGMLVAMSEHGELAAVPSGRIMEATCFLR